MPSAGASITESLPYDGGRLVTVHVPPAPADAMVLAADGGWHEARLRQVLAAAGSRSTMVVCVHGRTDDDDRLREYVPRFDDERFAAHESFFVDDVRRWVEADLGVALPPGRTAVWGASLGAELALAVGLRHPDAVGVVLAASPGAGYRPPAELPARLPRTYLVAGRQEPFFHDNATRWADALRDAGADVVMATRDGEHGGEHWWEELPAMLTWAFGR